MSQRSRISCRLPGRARTAARKQSSSTGSSCSSLSLRADPVATEAAQRASDSIDEDIKKEAARRQAARRREVKGVHGWSFRSSVSEDIGQVILLGQAESGKSTLQKQLQLYYASHTLDAERPSWRIVVYANLIKAVRTVLEELEYEFSLARIEYPWPEHGASPGSGPTDVGAQNEINELRRALLPLISLEGSLSSELSDGIAFVGTRHASLFPPRQALFTRPGTRPLADLHRSHGAVVATNRAAQVLGTTVHVIEALWRHRSVGHLLHLRKLRLDESGTSFLNQVQRISKPDYVPSTDDVLHVRLQTVGVIEHSIKVNIASGVYIWKIYDVSGIYLEEDPLTNRVSDSLQLLTSVCANPLLKNAQMILLLNKTDILRRKLEAGIQIRDYITSYGARANNFSTAAEYFRTHFLAAYKKKDVFGRTLYIHFTSMLDVYATQVILASMEDLIMRRHIAQAGLV
ncbi:guanine nucleotide binding protein, alpha subunit [Mycena pura]|uniref:Guanine nucleotide binding protein, alpha subunit n=1 Tax=Mycena pura TaxID=153505 RepID=A0AAD6VLA7_9AGAR|nr:guanine nucleotide binding protein, alpha subunit [Mycena pura]